MRFNFNLEEIKYIKILLKDSEGKPHSLKSAIKRMNSREIIACTKFIDGLTILPHQDITLSIVCNDGLYRTITKLKSIEFAEPYMIFALETPEGMEYQQNREYFRVVAKYECIYSFRSGAEMLNFNAHTIDISANGVSIFMPINSLPESDAVLTIRIDGKDVYTKARCVRSEKLADGYKLSFAYTLIDETERDIIAQACIRKQLEERRNSLK